MAFARQSQPHTRIRFSTLSPSGSVIGPPIHPTSPKTGLRISLPILLGKNYAQLIADPGPYAETTDGLYDRTLIVQAQEPDELVITEVDEYTLVVNLDGEPNASTLVVASGDDESILPVSLPESSGFGPGTLIVRLPRGNE